MILNKEQKSHDIWTNGQFRTLANILLQENVWLVVSAECVLGFLNFEKKIIFFLIFKSDIYCG